MKRILTSIITIVIIVIVIIIYLFSGSESDTVVKSKTVKSDSDQSSVELNVIPIKINEKNTVKKTAKTDFPEVKDLVNDAAEKDTVITSNFVEHSNDNINLTKLPVSNNKSVEVYKTPYFQISYPTDKWDYAEGKSIDLPVYVDIPKHVPEATVQFINKKNDNSIFLHISYSGGADFNKMSKSEISKYVQYVYNDYSPKDINIINKNTLKFVVLEFTPGNDSSMLVRQYLTTKTDLLFTLTFIENKSDPISEKMVNEIFKSLQIK